jgi:hypothetical protein
VIAAHRRIDKEISAPALCPRHVQAHVSAIETSSASANIAPNGSKPGAKSAIVNQALDSVEIAK